KVVELVRHGSILHPRSGSLNPKRRILCKIKRMYRGGWWSWGHNEPELRSLIEWIDRKAQYYGDWRGGVLGALMGTAGGLMGGTIGVLAGGLNLNPGVHPWVVIGPVLAFLGVSGGSLFWYFRGRTRDQKAAARAFAESRGLYQKLLMA